MYCNNCGKKLNGSEKYCPECGKKQEIEVIPTIYNTTRVSTENYRSASIALGIIALVGSLLVVFSPIALILSIIGLVLAIKSHKNNDNVPGLILNGVGLFLSFIITGIMTFIIAIVINVSKYGITDIGEYLEERIEEISPNEYSEYNNYGDNF